ncbi:MAG: hypothetical protein M5T61_15610 [Acidimicrobiia bacterium]|nr:hypothetical protein [Acidimicrobiia bacterium]
MDLADGEGHGEALDDLRRSESRSGVEDVLLKCQQLVEGVPNEVDHGRRLRSGGGVDVLSKLGGVIRQLVKHVHACLDVGQRFFQNGLDICFPVDIAEVAFDGAQESVQSVSVLDRDPTGDGG